MGNRCKQVLHYAVVFLLATQVSFAKPKAKINWDSFMPPKDHLDWMQFKSGEWLRGELKFLYSDDLEFESEELDTMNVDLSDVWRIRTSSPREVSIAGKSRRSPSKVFFGLVEVERKTIKIVCNDEVHIFPRKRLVSIAYGESVQRKQWSGKIALGANSRSGNSQELEYNIKVNAKKRTTRSRFSFDYIGNWSENLDVQTVDNQRMQVYRDALSSKRVFWRQIVTEYFRDPFQNVDSRIGVGTGIGYHLIEDQDEQWTLSIGGGYQKVQYSSSLAGTEGSSKGPLVFFSSEYERDITKDVELEIEYRFQVTDEASGTFNHHSMITLSNEIGNNLDLDISFVWDRIKDPVADSSGAVPEQDDYRFLLSIGYDL